MTDNIFQSRIQASFYWRLLAESHRRLSSVFENNCVCYLLFSTELVTVWKRWRRKSARNSFPPTEHRKTSNSIFALSLFSKGIQNRASTVFIEVVPAGGSDIVPTVSTKSVGKYSILINSGARLALCKGRVSPGLAQRWKQPPCANL